MAEEVSPKVIKKTQDLLGSVIKKPPLHEKLLKKPPFRFLHDVVHNVIRTTRFLDGLYTPEELNSENIKDKEAKIAFLQKAIDALIMVTGASLATRPSKVVAGHEPERTNEFLQLLAKAAAKKLDSAEAVKKVLAGEKPSGKNKSEKKDVTKKKEQRTPKKEPSAKTTDAKKVANGEASSQKLSASAMEGTSKTKSARTKKPREVITAEDGEGSSSGVTANGHSALNDTAHSTVQDTNEGTAVSVESALNGMRPRTRTKKEASKETDQGQTFKESPPEPDKNSVEMGREAPRPESVRPVIGRPPTSLRNEQPRIDVNPPPGSEQEQSLQPPDDDREFDRPPTRSTLRTSRPRSSRPAAPRIRKRETAEEAPPVRVETAKPVENVILDNKQEEDDDKEEESFVMAEPVELTVSKAEAEADVNGLEQGSLVRQLLETKKELEGGSHHLGTPSTVEQEKPLNRQQNRERSAIENLRRHIQSVSRSALPLGRLLDLMSEDLDSMNAELLSWKEEHACSLKAYAAEQSLTNSTLEPLKQNLEELDQQIAEQKESISATKAKLFNNTERIGRLLASANLSH